MTFDSVPMIRYRARATNNVMSVGMNYLSDLIVRPGIEKKMWPLVQYRGAMNLGHAHRLWNMTLLMMAAECETLADGYKIFQNPAFAQLCGPVRAPGKMTLFGYFGRLWNDPHTTDNIPGLTEYVKSMQLGPCRLTPVSLETAQQFCAPWRISTHRDYDKNAEKPESGARALYYPYIVHDPKVSKGSDLVLLANKLVPAELPHDIRADVCQDLIMSILSGAVSRENAFDHVQKHIRRAFKAVEFKYTLGGLKTSFDAPVSNDPDSDRQLHEVISDGSYRHWADEMEESDDPSH